jgi:hypothetical protein
MPFSSYRLALIRYTQLRHLAFDHVFEEALRAGVPPSLRLTDIDQTALAAWEQTWKGHHRAGAGGWDWIEQSAAFRRRPTAFHVAVWSGEMLCGLAVGRLSKKRRDGRRHTVSLHIMEGAPHSHPLKGMIAPVVFAVAQAYGRLFGATRLRLVSPLPGVLRLYRQLGFAIARTGGRQVYCEREITYEHLER